MVSDTSKKEDPFVVNKIATGGARREGVTSRHEGAASRHVGVTSRVEGGGDLAERVQVVPNHDHGHDHERARP